MKTVYVLGAMVGVGAFLYFRRGSAPDSGAPSAPSQGGDDGRIQVGQIGGATRPPSIGAAPSTNFSLSTRDDVKGSNLPSRPSAPSMGVATQTMTGLRIAPQPRISTPVGFNTARLETRGSGTTGRPERPERPRRPGTPEFGGVL